MGEGEMGEGRVSSQRLVKPSAMTVWTTYESKKCQQYAQACLDGLREILLSLG